MKQYRYTQTPHVSTRERATQALVLVGWLSYKISLLANPERAERLLRRAVARWARRVVARDMAEIRSAEICYSARTYGRMHNAMPDCYTMPELREAVVWARREAFYRRGNESFQAELAVQVLEEEIKRRTQTKGVVVGDHPAYWESIHVGSRARYRRKKGA